MKFYLILFITIMLSCVKARPADSEPMGQDTLPLTSVTGDSSSLQFEQQRKQIADQMALANITHFVIRVADGKFGYTIFIDGKMYIEQKSIPAVQGTSGFETEEDAEMVALLVIQKLKEGMMPPAVTVEELKELGINHWK